MTEKEMLYEMYLNYKTIARMNNETPKSFKEYCSWFEGKNIKECYLKAIGIVR